MIKNANRKPGCSTDLYVYSSLAVICHIVGYPVYAV
jgi:hypothetical protein